MSELRHKAMGSGEGEFWILVQRFGGMVQGGGEINRERIADYADSWITQIKGFYRFMDCAEGGCEIPKSAQSAIPSLCFLSLSR